MLIMEVGFPHGRCYAAEADEPDRPEWPPHPSRLFSALVAAAHMGQDGLSEDSRKALEWLEQQDPPAIETPAADTSAMPINYVPHNDKPDKGSGEDPILRSRKDRHFPAAYILGQPVVRYAWQQAPPPELLAALDRLSAGTTHLGTAHSMVVARAFSGELDTPSHRPSPIGGEFLRVPAPGRLGELIELHGRDKPAVRRPPSPNEPYVAYRSRRHRRAGTSPFDEIQILRLPGITHGLESAEPLARALRRAVMSRIEDPIPEAVHGHEDGPHVGWWPLGDVGHPHARGRILGIAVGMPADMPETDRQRLLDALGEVIRHGIRLDDGRDISPEPLSLEQTPPIALRRSTWTAPSRVWTTLTPIVPDRLPKRQREDQIIRSLEDSLIRAGCPRPEHIIPGGYSPLDGVPSAKSFRNRLPRYHATVVFSEPVAGPLAAGRLRYFGIGLLRPNKEAP